MPPVRTHKKPTFGLRRKSGQLETFAGLRRRVWIAAGLDDFIGMDWQTARGEP
jgi:hypothetical protein